MHRDPTCEHEMSTDPVEYLSDQDFAATLAHLVQRIEGAGMTVFAKIDHAAGAHSAGMEMPPTVVRLSGNPKGGTPIMQAVPQTALDLPLRVLVREDADKRTRVS